VVLLNQSLLGKIRARAQQGRKLRLRLSRTVQFALFGQIRVTNKTKQNKTKQNKTNNQSGHVREAVAAVNQTEPVVRSNKLVTPDA
jgi:hypothetical protein